MWQTRDGAASHDAGQGDERTYPAFAQPGPASSPAAAAAGWLAAPYAAQSRRCPQCGMDDYTGADHCLSCGARLPRPGAIAPIGSAQYPDFAPDGRVASERLAAGQPARSGKRTGAAVGAGAGLLAILAKFAVLGKVLLPVLSAVVSIWVYTLLWGWQFALGLVALLFVHEMGHVVAIRAKGLPASLPIFIPLLGAAVFLRRMPQNVRDEAEIAIAGPLLGTLGSVACLAVYGVTGQRIWLVLAFFGFFLNLINLVPVSPFDGGRVAAAISRWLWPIGLAVMAVALWYTGNLVLLLFLVLGLSQTIGLFRQRNARAHYYEIPFFTRAWITLLYFGLAAGLTYAFVVLQPLIAVGGSPFGG
ncbi:MAG TPA: site-2 protease family protein [Ktedonobacterales bacterium]|jgi:Zn-dependent protease|nr:site-2 protease family protein [Ktedonobacterales bacterium]